MEGETTMTLQELHDLLLDASPRIDGDSVIISIHGGEIVFHDLTEYGSGQWYFSDGAD
jgi:hypothetical protein